jgi:hypothetical protein
MANTTTGVFQELVLPAIAEVQTPPEFTHAMLSRIWIVPRVVQSTVGEVINVNIPIITEADVTDIGIGSVVITDATHTNVPMTVNNNLSIARRIQDFVGVRSPLDFKQMYLQPMLETLSRRVNEAVTDLVTAANFAVHASITGGADTFTRANLSTAWGNLMTVGVPNDPANLFFVTHPIPYATMLADTTWIQESIVGINAAEAAQQRTRIISGLGAEFAFDQKFPLPAAGTYAGLLFHRWAISMQPVQTPFSGSPHVEETTYTVPGTEVGFRLQIWYDPSAQGFILHAHCVFALAVTRPNFGSFLVTT